MTNQVNISEILKNPTIKRMIWIFTSIIFILGSLLISASFIFSSKPIRVILFYVGSYIDLTILLGILIQYSDMRVSRQTHKLMGAILAIWLTLAFYFFPNSSFRWLISGSIAIVLLLVAFLSRLLFLFFEGFIPRMFYKDYKISRNNNAWGFTGVAIMEPGNSTLYGKKILREFLMNTLKSRSVKPYYFVNILSYNKYSSDYAVEAIKHSSAMFVVFRAGDKSNEQFKKTVNNYIHLTPGRIFIIQISSKHFSDLNIYEGRGIDTFEFVPSTRQFEMEDTAEIISQMTNQLTTNVIPIGTSDDKLPSDLRSQIEIISSRSLPPLAKCYLRFRLSQSHVERFMSLLDCIELIIKLSVMYISIIQWSKGDPKRNQVVSLYRPTLGRWIDYLRKLLDSESNDRITEMMNQFWKQAVDSDLLEVIENASDQGFEWKKTFPTNRLEWLDWFIWIRNVSRGHGALEESQVSSLWQTFHGIFLRMILGLNPLLIDCSTVVQSKTSTNSKILKGWNRITVPSESEDMDELHNGKIYLRCNGNGDQSLYPTFPFMLLKGEDVLFLNSIEKSSIDYINISSGALIHFENIETNPYQLWKTQTA